MDKTIDTPRKRKRWPLVVGVLVIGGALSGWWWLGSSRNQEAQGARRPPGAIPVVTARAEERDVPVRLQVNGTVTTLRSVDVRAQVTSTVREVHIQEGQTVKAGQLLFSLDSRNDEANLRKAQAQVEKDKSDLLTAKRNLDRQVDLFKQKFISQAALDTAQNQVDSLTGQMAIDTAAVESARVAVAYDEIRAPFAGRTGVINVRAGSLVQPSANASTTTSPPLVTITQIDPISIAFTLPETELPALQAALAAGDVPVTATPQAGGETVRGKVTFVDNAVDSSTGTIRVKADFDNRSMRLWPGMYATVQLAPRTIAHATVVPAQAVQTGPDSRFIYVVGDDRKVQQKTIQLAYVEKGFAVVSGVAPGARVVVEGAQNLRPGSAVAEAKNTDLGGPAEAVKDEAPKAGKRKGEKPA
ncbi:MAG TPA: efflux RND transporter periplasmic adaptor subunit [Usitatibacter sp.]|jgi:RND family efflux transporter MFP subunit|nr:efflux RND transporter periplasmic adaptor subunit [Usitatibacter sp.]